jgi:Flp pilus assembly protein TadG
MNPILTIASLKVQAAVGVSPWWYQALTSRLSLLCLALLIGCTIGLALCTQVLWRLGRSRRSAKKASLASDTRGTAMMEFALVFPIALFLILLLTQTTLVMAGNLYVHYAAFAATRAAIVTIPADYSAKDNEGPNVLTVGGAKFERIRMAAVWALTPVGGKGQGGSAPADQFAQGIDQYYSAMGQKAPYWADHVIPDRVRYADANTSITVLITTATTAPPQVTFEPLGNGQTYTYGYGMGVAPPTDPPRSSRDPVTIQVTHRFNLSIPYVRAIFADNRSKDISYSTISAQYTLTNEGIDTSLPPRPTRPSDGVILDRYPLDPTVP